MKFYMESVEQAIVSRDEETGEVTEVNEYGKIEQCGEDYTAALATFGDKVSEIAKKIGNARTYGRVVLKNSTGAVAVGDSRTLGSYWVEPIPEPEPETTEGTAE